MQHFEQIKEESIEKIEASQNLSSLEEVRVALLGKQGKITQSMKTLATLSPAERKEQGIILNQLRDQLTNLIEEKKALLKSQELSQRLTLENTDVSLPVRPEMKGFFHPLSQALFEITEIFTSMGFSVVEGPHIERDDYNFDALNIPPEHPARQEHDTFYMPIGKDGLKKVLRTHTSPVEVRTMLSRKPPICIISPGRVFRSDYDQTHTPTFHQVEGLIIAEEIHMGHLKYCIREFCRRIFNIPNLPVRFRPSYFPFTEPSAEVDIGCLRRKGELVLGQGDDWLEIMGCGMLHPNVLENCHINPTRFQGLAFGMGIERIAMLKYGIPDLRSFYETDIRWLRRYGFSIAEGLGRGES
jgi:phenylalanyl-tRNA synthetase alpha chain